MDKRKTALIRALLGTGFLVFGIYSAATTSGVWYLIVAALLLIIGGLGADRGMVEVHLGTSYRG
ncbi:hypothetical protein J3A64_003280 [Pseudarthrobacter sp. PvP004]|nr:hypothetical protein [Pseudarthrobacter sp. PvP004]